MGTPLPVGAPDVAYVVDLSSIARGLFHVLPPLQAGSGEPVAVTSAVAARLVHMIRELRPAFLAVCADGPTAVGDEEDPVAARLRRYWRASLWRGYKASRTPPGPEYDVQIERVLEIVQAHRIPVFRASGFEGDDFFGALVPRLQALGLRVVIVSKDHDLWQLARKGVAIWDGDFGHELTDARDVERRYHLPPGWLAAALALAGVDDEAPGLPGIGLERAAALITRHCPRDGAPLDAAGALERVLSRWQWESTAKGKPSKVGIALRDGAELARLSLRLVELRGEGAPVTLDLAELRTGWEMEDAQRVRALGEELSIAVLRSCPARPKAPLDERLARRLLESGSEERR